MDTNTLVLFSLLGVGIISIGLIYMKIAILDFKKELLENKIKEEQDAKELADKIFEMLCNPNLQDFYIWNEGAITLSKKGLIKKGKCDFRKNRFELCFSYKKRKDGAIQVVARVEEYGWDIYTRSAIIKQ